HQGSDRTLPYQAWVTRESAKLFRGFAPWGRKAFSARVPAAARWGVAPLTSSMVTRRPPGVPRQSAGCRRAVAARDDRRRGCVAVPPGAAGPRPDVPGVGAA